MRNHVTLELIEKIHLLHFISLPKKFGFTISEYHGAAMVYCGLGSSMFNIVYGALSTDPSHWPQDIQRIIDFFNGQPFAWWIPPSVRNQAFSDMLTHTGFVMGTYEHAMLCDLHTIQDHDTKHPLRIQRVEKNQELADFVSVIEPYEASARLFYTQYAGNISPHDAELLFVGYLDDQPITIATLYETTDAAGIFNLFTREDVRREGYSIAMVEHLLAYTKKHNRRYATLLASGEAGHKTYQHLGFEDFGTFDCFEYQEG